MSGDLGAFFHTISPDYAIPASAIVPACSDPAPESCSDAGDDARAEIYEADGGDTMHDDEDAQ